MFTVTLKFESLDDASWVQRCVIEAQTENRLSPCSSGILKEALTHCKNVSVQRSNGSDYTDAELKRVRMGYPLNQ